MTDKIYLFDTKNYFEINKLDDIVRPCVVIIPGGGYDHTSIRESKPISDAFIKKGYHTMVLKYREDLAISPMPMNELAYAIDYMKKQSYVSKIIGIGFSAGAHLLSSVCVHHKELPYDCLTDLNIICYPVITSNHDFAHESSFNYLLEDKASDEIERDYYSIEKNIQSDFPKSFVWHTSDDNSVNIHNSLLLIDALIKNDITFEYHIFPSGVHGLSLANYDSYLDDESKLNLYVARWFDMAMLFVEKYL